jgi:hypothetical protein
VGGVIFHHRSCATQPEKLTSLVTPKLPCQNRRFCRANRGNGKVAITLHRRTVPIVAADL